MMRNSIPKTGIHKVKRYIILLLCVLFIAAMIPHAAASTPDEARKVVRVGCFESSFNITDQTGRRSGYAYEYQIKISAYTGWRYQYITGSWPELLQMLIDGEIDLMSDVSYTEERAEKMLYPDIAMGTEDYYIFTAPDNKTISAEDYSTLNGKKIGVNKNSVQAAMFPSWAERHGVEAELVELTCSESDSLKMLATGKFDAYITPNVQSDGTNLVPVFKVGYSEFYFAVNKDRPDLLEELNFALNRIHDENPYYNHEMFEKHVQAYGSNAFLTSAESKWLESHGKVRVGYQDDYLAFCAEDGSGKLTGALKDYLEDASECFSNGHVDFEPVAYPTPDDALDAMERGEVDCVFPANFDSYDSETRRVLVTPSIIRSEIYAIVRESDQKIFSSKEHVVVAVTDGDPNYSSFVSNNFPDWRPIYYPDIEECLESVSQSIADCMLISNYRYNNISRICEKYNLTIYSAGVSQEYGFAVNEDEIELYSILAKMAGLVPGSSVNAALSYYVAQDAKETFGDFIDDNIVFVVIASAAVLLLILFYLIRSVRSEKKAKELIQSTETDKLTGLYTRDYFAEYADSIYRAEPGIPRDAVAVNIDQFHSINALNGREFGDKVLRIIAAEIAVIAQENDGIACRAGADRFEIYCKHLSNYQQLLDRLQKKVNEFAENASIRVRMGVMPWEADLEPVQLFDRARTACNMARGHYRKHLAVFDERLHQKEIFDQRLLNDLRRALDNREFEVYYQPKYDVSSDKAVPIGAEALIRWRHPELGMLSPDKFIPLFEKNGKINEVDKYVWNRVAEQTARWLREYGRALPVSVNLSRIDVFDSTLEETLDRIITDNGLSRDMIRLEVTESAYTENPNQVIRFIAELRRRGYIVEMDDFGTGYSSLNMLSDMQVDVLKMDRSFIRSIETSEKDVQMVALILGIADNLHISVVAEGVETEEQVRILREQGCTLMQGYYFSRPLPPKDFENIVLKKMQD